jgi:SAM-dependent methyltransferase
MTLPTTPGLDRVDFDAYAGDYDAALERGLSVSGEDKAYFARGRVEWLARCLHAAAVRPRTVLDFGCGTGSAAPFLLEILGADRILGVDPSAGSLDVARRSFASARVEFAPLQEFRPEGRFDLVFCNGVFHHIPPAARPHAVDSVLRSLRPGGLFACWENNPWNPGTRYVMSRIPFDRDAIPLAPPEARRLLRASGFDVVRTDFLFIFPRVLRALRGLEPRLSRLPLGAQYQVLGRRP